MPEHSTVVPFFKSTSRTNGDAHAANKKAVAITKENLCVKVMCAYGTNNMPVELFRQTKCNGGEIAKILHIIEA
jgi:hypothetical protein